MKDNSVSATYLAGPLQSKSSKIILRNLEEVTSKYNISANEWKVLSMISTQSNITLSQIAKILEVELPYATELINDLVNKELVSKTKAKEDKRNKILVLSNKAAEVLPLVENDIKLRMRELLFGINNEQLKTYISILERIIVNDSNIVNSAF